jgi:hypothetical protein
MERKEMGNPKSIQDLHQLNVTKMKLKELEDQFTAATMRPMDNELIREQTLRSLKKRINQFKEEITRYEAQVRRSAELK